MDSEIKCLSKDLLALYCKTKNAKIEGLFVKLAASKPLVVFLDETKNKTNIPSTLNNPSFYNMLLSLTNLKAEYDLNNPDKYNEYVNKINAIAAEFTVSFMAYGSYIMHLGDIATKHPLLRDVYGQLLQRISINMKKLDSKGGAIWDNNISKGSVEQDLETISDIYYNGAAKADDPETKKKKYNMYLRLLDLFAKDLNTAYASNPKVVEAINNGALYQPNKFQDILTLTYDKNVVDQAQEVVNNVFSRIEEKDVSTNYEYIKREALSRMGANSSVVAPDKTKATDNENVILKKYKEAIDSGDDGKIKSFLNVPTGQEVVRKYMTPEERRALDVLITKYGIQPVKVSDSTQISQSDWTLPLVMSMITAIFNTMYRKLYT